MGIHPFPHPLDHLPRPGMREIRARPALTLPPIRNERSLSHDGKQQPIGH